MKAKKDVVPLRRVEAPQDTPYNERDCLDVDLSIVSIATTRTSVPVLAGTAHNSWDDRMRGWQISAWAPFFQVPDRADGNAYKKGTAHRDLRLLDFA
ncbi:MAG: hypothetical protein WCB79_01120 [Halobacteriota archaeon]